MKEKLRLNYWRNNDICPHKIIRELWIYKGNLNTLHEIY
jgi:hypothetical protein